MSLTTSRFARCKSALLLCAALAAGHAVAQEDQRRFRLLPFSEMTPAQRAYADEVMKGPAGAGGTGSASLQPGASSVGAPYNLYLRDPALAEKLLQAAQQLRFHSVLPGRLNEFAILIAARQWDAQYEWFAHERLAIKAGLKPSITAALAQGQRPQGMAEDETAVYDFAHELHTTHAVSDATFKAAVDRFGEQGVIDLIAVSGYYVLVSMLLNVDRSPLPEGVKPPLPTLAAGAAR